LEIAELFETMSYGPVPENAAPALEWLDAHGRCFGHFVGGTWQTPSGDDAFFDTVNPADGRVLARVARGTADDVDAAVRAAAAALPAWQRLSGHARARYLYALARHVQKRSRLLAVLETLDNGKPIRESRDIDIPLVARHFYHHAGWAQLVQETFRGYGAIGVVGQIIPWNFPLLMLAWKIAPALAAGNTVVLKPAEFTPLTALCFAELCRDAGLPPGVVNIVTGDGRTGELIVQHPDIGKIAFTGSTEVGRLIRVATAGSGKKLSLELGGKSPFLVFDDADLDSAVEGVVDAIWLNQGQVCCAGSRILVQEGVAERLVGKLRARMERLRVGNPLDKAVDIGAIIAPVQLEKIQRLVRAGVEEGATLWQPSWSCPEEGLFYPPTLFTDVAPAATVAQVEIFGPVVVLMTFRTPAEAVALANNTRYGLAASIWTENINLALDVAPQVKAGTIWINCTNLFDAASGFGGYRESGFGREGGREGMWEYLRPLRRGVPTAEAGGPPGAEPAAGAVAAGTAAASSEAAGTGAAASEAAGTAGATSEAAASAAGSQASNGDGRDDMPAVDRTAKLYIGGRQVRPDQGYSLVVRGPGGVRIGEVGRGSRKDIRNAVEAAHAASGWARATAHLRAQVLYHIAENLAARADEFAARLHGMSGASLDVGQLEVERSIDRLYSYAAWADKWDGQVHHTPLRNVTLAMPEPVGVIGICAPERPALLGVVSAVMPAVATGNRVVVVPSGSEPLAATDLYQVLDTSDLPDGVINIVTGQRDELAAVLAAHDDVDAVWYFGSAAGGAEVERLSAGNMKRTWVEAIPAADWSDVAHGGCELFLRQATQVKNIWVPYGE
jgi:aldehyde dehydrogenase (NAD+)